MNSLEDQSQGEEGSGDDGMDIDSTVTENVKRFRKNSLALVVYPWATGVVMESELSNVFNEDHFAFVSLTRKSFYTSNSLAFQRFSAALDKFDMNLATTSPIHAYVRTAMRDTTSDDRYSHKTTAQIVSAESKDLKSSGHASDVCSLLTAYRLLDIIYALEHPDNAIKAPHHRRLKMDFGSFNVSALCCVRRSQYSHYEIPSSRNKSKIGVLSPIDSRNVSRPKRTRSNQTLHSIHFPLVNSMRYFTWITR